LTDFNLLKISGLFVSKLRENGIVQATPIQERAIPIISEGKDLIAQAQTGTGKTLAFVLPILEKIKNENSTSIQALIVTPTRELALQITEEINKLINDIEGLEVLAVYGGQDVEKQLRKLDKGVQIVVGTPGRLLDHIGRETIDLGNLSFLVLDEADQMLHIGFLDEVEKIINQTPITRQTMLFSATMPPEIRKLARKHLQDPVYVQIEKTQRPAENVQQIALYTTDRAKQATLIELIQTHRPFLAVIFCRTKRRVSKLYDALSTDGFSCDELHGDLSQGKREKVMKRFRDADIQLLVATDVAARGLDVEGVTHVFNYDIPLDAESYVHRIGRTGRAGMKGLAITLYSAKDRSLLDEIESVLNINIEKKNIQNTDVEEKAPNKTRSTKKGQTDKNKRQKHPGKTSRMINSNREKETNDSRGTESQKARIGRKNRLEEEEGPKLRNRKNTNPIRKDKQMMDSESSRNRGPRTERSPRKNKNQKESVSQSGGTGKRDGRKKVQNRPKRKGRK